MMTATINEVFSIKWNNKNAIKNYIFDINRRNVAANMHLWWQLPIETQNNYNLRMQLKLLSDNSNYYVKTVN